MVIVQWN